jgi:opacity protein-like surface antigen
LLKKSIILASLAGLFSGIFLPYDIEAVERTPNRYSSCHFVGGRFGPYIFTGNEMVADELSNPVDFSSSSLYAEFFYAHRLAPVLSAEFSFGVFSQGDLEYIIGEDVLLGSVKVYPILLSLKYYLVPIEVGIWRYPYIRLGGGLIYGSREATVTYYYQDYFTEDSEAKFTYTVGAGIDLPVADQIGLNLDFKYTPVKFGKPLAGFRDYSGWELSVGVGYIVKSKK